MPIKTITQNNLTWVNIEKIDEESLDYLKKHYKFHPLDYEDLMSEQQIPKIDSYNDYLFIVLIFPHWNAETKNITEHEIDIFIGKDFLITVQNNKSKEMKNFFYRCMNNRGVKADWMSSSGFLLYRLVEALFENTLPMLNSLGRKLSELEQQVYWGTQNSDIIRELALHRRDILHFRRILDPQRYLISSLAHVRRPFLEENLVIYFDDISDYLNKTWTVIETYKETINGLHTTVESLINRRTNKVISTLTVISVSLLPLHLLAGIYGMNIDGLPFAHKPALVWVIFAAMSVVIVLTIFILRKKKSL